MNAPVRRQSFAPAEPLLPRIVAEDDTHVAIVVNVPKEFIRQHRELFAYLLEMSEP